MIEDSLPTETATEREPLDGSATLIQYVEVWVPAADGRHLNLTSACRLGKSKLLITPKSTTVSKGAGVAGRAWNQNSATIVQESPSELIQHYCELSGENLVALVAIPIFHQTSMSGVVVLGLGPGYGAAELWTRDDRDELSVSMSYYSGLTSLEFIHQYVRFPKGGGFPGKIWKSGRPGLADDLGSNADVVSTFDHDAAEISAVIGLPVGSSGGFASCVLMLLSASQSPLARAVEQWECEIETKPGTDESPSSTAIAFKGAHDVFLHCDEHPGSEPEAGSDWRQAVCDRVAGQQTPLLISKQDLELPAGTAFALIVPVYRVKELVGIMNFMF